MTTFDIKQLADLLNLAEGALLSAECHLSLTATRKDIHAAQSSLAKAIRMLNAATQPTTTEGDHHA